MKGGPSSPETKTSWKAPTKDQAEKLEEARAIGNVCRRWMRVCKPVSCRREEAIVGVKALFYSLRRGKECLMLARPFVIKCVFYAGRSRTGSHWQSKVHNFLCLLCRSEFFINGLPQRRLNHLKYTFEKGWLLACRYGQDEGAPGTVTQ